MEDHLIRWERAAWKLFDYNVTRFVMLDAKRGHALLITNRDRPWHIQAPWMSEDNDAPNWDAAPWATSLSGTDLARLLINHDVLGGCS